MTSTSTLPRPAIWLALAATLLLHLPETYAQRAAYKPTTSADAIKQLTGYLGPRADSRILSMTAEEGRPQPLFWEITLLEPAAPRGRRVVRAGGGQVFYDRSPLTAASVRGLTPVINMRRLSLDSGRAFRIAESEATKNRIAFNHANYELLATTPDGPPLWVVTLVDDAGDTVGKVQLEASNGKILESVWNPAKVLPVGAKPGAAPQPTAQEQDSGSLERVGRSIDRRVEELKRALRN